MSDAVFFVKIVSGGLIGYQTRPWFLRREPLRRELPPEPLDPGLAREVLAELEEVDAFTPSVPALAPAFALENRFALREVPTGLRANGQHYTIPSRPAAPTPIVRWGSNESLALDGCPIEVHKNFKCLKWNS